MQIFFKSRTQARAFKSKNGKLVDHGTSAGAKRWAVAINQKVN